MKGLHDNHRKRMRDRYEREGLSGFEPHEVMELLLFQSLPRINTNPIGLSLMDTFGSLSEVLMASEEALCSVRGVGSATAALIHRVRDTMLFAMLNESDFLVENDALAMAAEYHLRSAAEGTVALLSREAVLDFTADDGDWTGLGEAMGAEILKHGITDCAVVVKCENGNLSFDMAEALSQYAVPCVFLLTDGVLCKWSDSPNGESRTAVNPLLFES